MKVQKPSQPSPPSPVAVSAKHKTVRVSTRRGNHLLIACPRTTSDVATISLLVGLVPVGLLSGMTMEAGYNETGISTFATEKGKQQQYRMRIPWKHPEYLHPKLVQTISDPSIYHMAIEMDPEALAGYLFALYTKVRS